MHWRALIVLGLAFLATNLGAQNKVLQLNGDDAFVQLPPDIYADLDQATIEFWVRVQRFTPNAHYLDFGQRRRELYLGHESDAPTLKLLITGADGQRHRIRIPRLLQRGEWFHVAAVTSPEGVQLYFNGLLAGTNDYGGSFSSLSGTNNFFGASNSSGRRSLFAGQLDEIRVWSTNRTGDQIAAAMFQPATGSEPNLASLWNFEDGTARDRGPRQHHGELMGGATVVPTNLPNRAEISRPGFIIGRVLGPDGEPANADLFLAAATRTIYVGGADQRGKFNLAVRADEPLARVVALQNSHGGIAEIPSVGGQLQSLTISLRELNSDHGIAAEIGLALRGTFASLEVDDRRRAIAALVKIERPTPEILATLAYGLDDPDDRVARLAQETLDRSPLPAPLDRIYEKKNRVMAYALSGLLVPLVAFHLLLFIFFPKIRSHLFFALFAATAAWMTFRSITSDFSRPDQWGPVFLASVTNSLLGLLFLYSLFYERLPRGYWAFLAVGVLIVAALLFSWQEVKSLEEPFRMQDGVSQRVLVFLIAMGLSSLLSLAIGIETIRVLILALMRRRKGAWILGFGFFAFLVLHVAPAAGEMFFSDSFVQWLGRASYRYLPSFGTFIFIACASVHLAADFAQTHRHLVIAKDEIETKNSQLAAAKESAEEAREAADTANQAKSRFLANMSHELRTPLNAIIGYSEMLQEEATELAQPGFIPDLQRIHGAGRHLLDLINDVLDLSKIEAGRMTLFPETFDLLTLLKEVAATLQPMVEKNGNTLEIDCPPDVGFMYADLTKVRQILFNLLSNAAKFTERGLIKLEVRRERESPASIGQPASTEKIVFRVSDTGIGMAPEQMARLFQPFTQADASTTRKYGGTGLGLVISRKFCLMMGGELSAQSELGRGSTFTVEMPQRIAGPSNPPPLPAPSNLPVILVIDDNSSVRDLMQRSLTREGFSVALAASGAEGLALARQLHPVAITLDVMMPGLDGWSVLAAFKADPALSHIPVLIVSVVDDKKLAFDLGATEYLTKPIDWARLHSLLEKYRPHGQLALLVEDDRGTRENWRRELVKHAWETIEAPDGRRALDEFTRHKPNLILLDLMMPEMDGFEFLRRLRQMPGGAGVPVIVVTAKDLTADDMRQLSGAVQRIISKDGCSLESALASLRDERKSKP